MLGSQIALGLAQHLISDHKLLDAGRPKERRIKVRVKLPVSVVAFHKWRTMPAHRVRERCFKEVIVARQQLFGNACEEDTPLLI